MSGSGAAVSVVVPSYQQGRFLSDALESVLGQDVEAEVIVLDGGSTDETLDVIKRYEPRLAYWRSGPDDGQAAAINEGFERASAPLLCWLNSDDMFLPGTLRHVVDAAGPNPARFFHYGGGVWLQHDTLRVRSAPARPFDAAALAVEDYLIQPSTFWSRDVWATAGPLDVNLRFAFDWEWFLRAVQHADVTVASRLYAVYRLHADQKTGSDDDGRARELREVVSRHAAPEWVRRYERMAQLRRDRARMLKLADRLHLRPDWAVLVTSVGHPSRPKAGEWRECALVLRSLAG